MTLYAITKDDTGLSDSASLSFHRGIIGIFMIL